MDLSWSLKTENDMLESCIHEDESFISSIASYRMRVRLDYESHLTQIGPILPCLDRLIFNMTKSIRDLDIYVE